MTTDIKPRTFPMPAVPMSEASCVACGEALTLTEEACGDGQCIRCFEEN